MKVVNLSDKPSAVGQFLYEMRHNELQKSAQQFRSNMQTLAHFLAYELSKELIYKKRNVQTPLAETEIDLIDEQLVICSILRAALPLHNGLLAVFPNAESGFIGAQRAKINETEFEIKVDYVAIPDVGGKHLIIADPMLATGRSVQSAIAYICAQAMPKKISLVSVFSAPEGLKLLEQEGKVHTVFTAVIDQKLNAKSYIIPGLGDAGDLAYGKKL